MPIVVHRNALFLIAAALAIAVTAVLRKLRCDPAERGFVAE